MGWYNQSWTYRVPITSQNAKVDEAVTDAYIDLSEMPTEFWDNVKNGGGDIRITQSDGVTEVAREVVSCNTATDTGEVHFDCTGIATGSDVLWYLYYGNAAASDYAIDDTYGAEAVWDSDYKMIHHFTGAAYTDLDDSTSNDHDITVEGGSPAYNQTGQVGKAFETDGTTGEYISAPDHADFDISGSDGGVSFWMYLNVLGDGANPNGVISQMFNTQNWSVYVRTTGEIAIGRAGVNQLQSAAAVISALGWHFIEIKRVNGTGVTTIYVDKVNEASAATAVWDNSAIPFRIGGDAFGGSDTFTDGLIDELRWTKGVTRSANYSSTVFNNQDDVANFWAIGDQELRPPAELVDSYNKLLLQFAGEDGAQADIDHSGHNHILTFNNDAQLDTAQYKFAPSSLLLDGVNDSVDTPDSPDWDFGTAPFTVDLWVRFNTVSAANYALINHGGGGADAADEDGWWMNFRGAALDDLSFGFRTGVTNYLKSESWDPAAATWYHVAATRDASDDLRLFAGGIQLGTPTANYTHNINIGAFKLRIGIRRDGTQDHNGWIGPVRISKGIARWTANFTPPPYPYHTIAKSQVF